MFQKIKNVKKLRMNVKKNGKQVLGRFNEFFVVKIHFWWGSGIFQGAKNPLFGAKSKGKSWKIAKNDDFRVAAPVKVVLSHQKSMKTL